MSAQRLCLCSRMGSSVGVPVNCRIGSMAGFVFGVLGVLLAVSSCGGDEAEPLGKYNEECMVLADCAEEFTCHQGLCTLECAGDAQCKAYDSKGRCGAARFCATACEVSQDCPNGLACLMTAFGSPTCAAAN